MSIHERSMETKAKPETVWRIWSDPSTWSQWNPDVVSARLDGPFASGATGTMTTKAQTHKIQITNVEPGRSFHLETNPFRSRASPFIAR